MPVTTRGAPVEVKAAPALSSFNSTGLLQATCPSLWKPGNSILDSSFRSDVTLRAASNGFVSTVLDAYLQHNHLVLRPEDVWFAILIQFSFYVNKHAEKLRKYFVDHAGKKKLEILQDVMEMPAFALGMTELIAKNVKDPALRQWIMPDFSTTTDTDRISAAIIMMGTMQKYFAYFCGITCGIPSVTLLGEKKDWEDILERVHYLAKFGSEHAELLVWNSVLTAVVSQFVKTFDNPDTPDVVKFWQKAVHRYSDNYSGEKHITGWVLAFCFWDAEGEPLVARRVGWSAKNWQQGVADDGLDWWFEGQRLSDLEWNDVPSGFAHVPIHIKDYTSGEKSVAKAIAGSVGWRVLDSDALFASTRGKGKASAKHPDQAVLSVSRKLKASGPSMLTDTTLVNQAPAQKPGILKQIAQKIFCLGSENDNDPTAGGKNVENDNSPQEANPEPNPADGRRKVWMNGREIYVREPEPEVPQLSDLSELNRPWAYEKGGKNDTLQPETGWWVMKTIDGQYGKDPDVPDVEFDSDAEGYDDDLARNGRPL